MEIRYYDERYYLTKFGIYERKMLELWQERNKKQNDNEMINYSDTINQYDLYTTLASKLVEEISLNNSLSKALILSVLVQSGVFSYNDFIFTNSDDILNSRLGLNVLYGKACCRNVSSFITDVFNKNGEFCENLTVVLLDKKNKRKALSEKANHMINLIKYEDTLYGYDSLHNFGSLYYFFNQFELMPIDNYEKTYMYYKPYIDFVYSNLSFEEIKERLNSFKESGKSRITQREFKEIIAETDEKLALRISLVGDFMKDTNNQIQQIKEKILEIKR